MNKYAEDINVWSMIIAVVFAFLFFKTAILCNDLQDISKEMVISEQSIIKDGLCEFKLNNLDNTRYYKIKENCNKYKIGDKLILTKEIK